MTSQVFISQLKIKNKIISNKVKKNVIRITLKNFKPLESKDKKWKKINKKKIQTIDARTSFAQKR